MHVQEFEQLVTEEMVRLFGISWEDAGGGHEPLEQAIAAGESPAEFVEWYGEKYDLISRSEWEGW